MDSGPDGVGPRTPGGRGSRRLLAAGIAVVVVLLAVVAVLATQLSSKPPAVKAAAPSPAPTTSPTSAVPVIYTHVAPSVVIVRTAPKLDIATLSPAKLPQVVVPATLGGGASVGASVVAIGNPLALTDSVSAGVISGLNRTADTDNGKFSGLIQFDASVNPGSSGGPLLDNHGLVIGIVVSIATPDGEDAFAGIGFAVPIGAALGGGGGTGSGKGPQI